MERKILIANTKTQKRYEIMTDATTLGELKAALSANGIDYSDMTFTEGISKTQLIDDASQLPSNVMYKGRPTNDLVILLTNTKKNISSGAMTRKEVYNIIKEHGLGEEIKNTFGKNYTVVPTVELEKFITENTDIIDDVPFEEPDPALLKADEYFEEIKHDARIGNLTCEAVVSLGERLVELGHELEVEVKKASGIEVKDAETNSMIDDILAGF